jgi:hypothetical protein
MAAQAPSLPYIDGMHELDGLDRERGRRDERHLLRLHLQEAPADYLEGALENDALGARTTALEPGRRPRSSPASAGIAVDAVPSGVAFGAPARAPRARAPLPPTCLAPPASAANVRVSPLLRRDAEKLLKVRLPELALGEKISLGRRGSRGIVEMLCREREPQVLRAVASNPRASEADVLGILTRPDLQPEFLGWLAEQSSWGQRRALRLALVRHPRTPPAAALRSIQALGNADLDALQHDAIAPRLARVAAERRLKRVGCVLARLPTTGRRLSKSCAADGR